ncbi:uncharacterized protein LOC119099713 isoform X2 [Pollicipes pollicipes]|uniref:uncharacterized protein LOC119099713 isoform X2 n=1 Tax=Pollicipes pollicipes TaxID=41117 RepID=UPI001884A01F|nr:uncharacterized protein LOC119099713 isoform X2 [Pollicipes pollicipes]
MWRTAAALLLLLAAPAAGVRHIRILQPVRKMRSSLLWLRHEDAALSGRRSPRALALRPVLRGRTALRGPGGWTLGRAALTVSTAPDRSSDADAGWLRPRAPAAAWIRPPLRRTRHPQPLRRPHHRPLWLPSRPPLRLKPADIWSSHAFQPLPEELTEKDTAKAGRLFKRAFSGNKHRGPVIRVSLRRNDTDSRKLERISRLTQRDRARSQRVKGGRDPRLSRIRQRQDTAADTVRDTGSSEKKRDVRVRVNFGGGAEFTIGARHVDKKTGIEQATRIRQKSQNDTELHSAKRSENATHTLERDKTTVKKVNVETTDLDQGITLSDSGHGR